MSNVTNYNFISNNVKRIQASKKRLELFQETHSSVNEEKQ